MANKPNKENELQQAYAIRLAWRWMLRSERLAQKTEEAFAGEPFSRTWPAEHPRNVRRFNTYLAQMREAFDLYVQACNVWAQAHGIAPEDASQWVTRASRAEQVGAVAPPGYKVGGHTPTQILLVPEEVTEEHIRVAEGMVAKRVARNAAEDKKPQ